MCKPIVVSKQYITVLLDVPVLIGLLKILMLVAKIDQLL